MPSASGIINREENPMGNAKRYKVTLRHLAKYTVEVDAENECVAQETAIRKARDHEKNAGFQRQVYPAPSSKTIQFQGPADEEWSVISTEIEPGNPRTA
jgi:hypothetical protein